MVAVARKSSRAWAALIAELSGKLSGEDAQEVRYDFEDLELHTNARRVRSEQPGPSAGGEEDDSPVWTVRGHLRIRPRRSDRVG